jgi:hypothetical protein
MIQVRPSLLFATVSQLTSISLSEFSPATTGAALVCTDFLSMTMTVLIELLLLDVVVSDSDALGSGSTAFHFPIWVYKRYSDAV